MCAHTDFDSINIVAVTSTTTTKVDASTKKSNRTVDAYYVPFAILLLFMYSSFPCIILYPLNPLAISPASLSAPPPSPIPISSPSCPCHYKSLVFNTVILKKKKKSLL